MILLWTATAVAACTVLERVRVIAPDCSDLTAEHPVAEGAHGAVAAEDAGDLRRTRSG